MIGVGGQWSARISIPEISMDDIVSTEEIVELSITESSGIVLPVFALSFFTRSREVSEACCHEGVVLQVLISKMDEDVISVSLRPMKAKSSSDVTGGSVGAEFVTLSGFMDAQGHLDTHCRTFPDMTSLEVVESVAGDYLPRPVKSNFTPDDAQLWSQPSIRNREFLKHLWLHSYTDRCSQVMGITSQGVLKFMNVPALLDAAPKWTLAEDETILNSTPDAILFSSKSIETNSGILNHAMGRGRRLIAYNVDDEANEDSPESGKIVPAAMAARALERSTSFTTDDPLHGKQFRTRNHHGRFWQAYNENITRASLLSNRQLSVAFAGQFYSFEIFDVANCIIPGYYEDQMRLASAHSGRYIIWKVHRHFLAQRMVTTLYLCREGFNPDRRIGDLP